MSAVCFDVNKNRRCKRWRRDFECALSGTAHHEVGSWHSHSVVHWHCNWRMQSISKGTYRAFLSTAQSILMLQARIFRFRQQGGMEGTHNPTCILAQSVRWVYYNNDITWSRERMFQKVLFFCILRLWDILLHIWRAYPLLAPVGGIKNIMLATTWLVAHLLCSLATASFLQLIQYLATKFLYWYSA